jgi:hypothetical protein
MRLLALAAALTLAAPAFAQPILEEPYAPYKLVGVMPDTGQVLLWDDHRGEYRLARAGEELDGWKVSGLDLKDARGPRVALQREDLIDELELVRLPRPGAVMVFKDKADKDRELAGATVIQTMPLGRPQPVAPSAPAPSMEAPPPAPAPVATPTTPPAPAAPGRPAVNRIEPTIITPPADQGPPPAMLQETRVLSRAEFDNEINDFDKLMASASVDRAEGGGFVFTRLERGSWLASLGFREGDVVRNIAGERVSSVEDAARVYARLRTMRSFTAEVQRGGTWVHIEIEIRDGK